MSKSSHRFNLIYQAIVATSLGIGTLSAQAVSLSQANIESAQHEPLSATIDVNGIDAKNFNAKLASGSVYQEMGLKQDADIQVKFTPTSDSSGKITLTSSTPISKPFTDVVLSLDNNGEQVVEPQTLLMPITSNTSIPASLTEPIMVASEQEQNLPVAGGATDDAPVALDLASGDPIDLSPLEEANLQAEKNLAVKPIAEDANAQTPADTTPTDMTVNAPSTTAMGMDSNVNAPSVSDDVTMTELTGGTDIAGDAFVPSDPSTQAVTTPKIISQQEQVLSALTPEGTNQQINILTEQITRKVLDSPEAIDAGALPFPTPSEPKLDNTPTAKDTKAQTGKGKKGGKSTNAPIETQSGDKLTYLVQSGDSLWGIASQIAKANNMSVMEVMHNIHAQNPDAFFDNNISRLKTNVSLNLPNYSVVPSQKAIQEAIVSSRHAKGGQDSKTAKTNKHGSDKAQTKKNHEARRNASKQVAQERAKSSKTPTKPLPKAQMTLVSPSNTGQATGTQAKSNNSGKGVGASNGNQLVNTLKSTRSQTAASATKVNSLNQELVSATQKLQLQNQKLAELENRLKALKDKKEIKTN